MSDSSDRDNDSNQNETDSTSAIEPTIVGGRPLARSQLLKGIPRGIEVLIKKASVDPDFREVLLEKRAQAAAEIELDLSATEAAMLTAIPAAQIEKIIDSTTVPTEHRRVFLGRAAAAMLSVIAGLGVTGCITTGIRPEGMRPDWPESRPITISGTKVPPGSEKLKVTPKEKGPQEVEVLVGYECPFDSGEITVSFRHDNGDGATKLDYRPTVVLVAKGKRDVTFHAIGTPGDTRWVQVELANKSKECEDTRRSGQSTGSNEYQAGEYVVEDCLITHIIEFRKTWKA